VGAVPGGATVELGIAAVPRAALRDVTFVLNDPDYTTATRVAAAINVEMGAALAEARDASGIEIRIPEEARERPVAFLARLEGVTVRPDGRARVVINERTGTVVSGGDVRISRVAVTHGDLRVTIATEQAVSQPSSLVRPGPGVRTAVVGNSRVEVDEAASAAFVSGQDTVADLVQALVRLRTHTRDIISILRAVKAAGALHADLIVQ
jgi:flagellar P-ring protein precursor FlgI